MPLYKVKEPPYVHAIQWKKKNLGDVYDFFKENGLPVTTIMRCGDDRLSLYFHQTGLQIYVPAEQYIVITDNKSIITYAPEEFERLHIPVAEEETL